MCFEERNRVTYSTESARLRVRDEIPHLHIYTNAPRIISLLPLMLWICFYLLKGHSVFKLSFPDHSPPHDSYEHSDMFGFEELEKPQRRQATTPATGLPSIPHSIMTTTITPLSRHLKAANRA